MLRHKATRYLLVGIANAVTGLSVIYGLKFFFDVGDVAANAAGYTIGVIQSFVLNRAWTLRSNASEHCQSLGAWSTPVRGVLVADFRVAMGDCMNLPGMPEIEQFHPMVPRYLRAIDT